MHRLVLAGRLRRAPALDDAEDLPLDEPRIAGTKGGAGDDHLGESAEAARTTSCAKAFGLALELRHPEPGRLEPVALGVAERRAGRRQGRRRRPRPPCGEGSAGRCRMPPRRGRTAPPHLRAPRLDADDPVARPGEERHLARSRVDVAAARRRPRSPSGDIPCGSSGRPSRPLEPARSNRPGLPARAGSPAPWRRRP